jgi:CMP/dCMP kinase
MDAIIISGLPAAGKTTVGGIVGKKLGLKVVGGGDVLKEMAEELGFKVTGEGWWDTPEGMKFMERRKQISDFDKRADALLIKKAKAGDVIITSYTMPWICDYGIKVWLSGSAEKRAERMAERDKSTLEFCIDMVKQRDEKNYRLYKSLYGIEFGKDLKPFDINIDTDNIDADKVADILIEFIKNRKTKTSERMALIEVGRVCIKKYGRDAGSRAVVTKVIDNNFVNIVTAVRQKERRCNTNHLEFLKESIDVKDKELVNKTLGIEERETPKRNSQKK